ncbi:FecR domain-containing protein [Sphingobacterium sp. lm-10]|uniref:FecR family protein n=1 Tax=Sphingobacterium sp. lm-10 TaxID=2944904 RepID=UPI0020204C7A|nr:FecR family protein [Sphingobacterium sp. lm-10]MCL7987871.1 FecR domain-containing protein [Sphingobacterium sp. lm-10]
MSRKQFKDILQRYLQGTCTLDETRMIEKWYDMLPEKEKLSLSKEDYQAMEERLWQKISQATPISKPIIKMPKKSSNWIAVAAAILLPVLVFTFWWPASPLEVVSNAGTDTLQVDLPDGSTIRLLQGARLSYTANFSPRKVALVGSAIFHVASDPLRPFSVLHGKMTTEVLGTEFLIQDMDTDESEVIVYSGKVQVTHTCRDVSLVQRIFTKPRPVELTINHRAVFNKKRETLQATIVEKPKVVVTDQAILAQVRYQAVDLAVLANKLSKIYELDIRVTPPHRSTTFTGDLDNLTLFEQLDLICAVTATRYVIHDRKISIL